MHARGEPARERVVAREVQAHLRARSAHRDGRDRPRARGARGRARQRDAESAAVGAQQPARDTAEARDRRARRPRGRDPERGQGRKGRRRQAGDAVEIDDLRIDFGARIVTVAGVAVTLTRLEFDVLATLARAAGTVVDRQRMLVEVWDTDWQGMERSLEVHVGNLRAKLDRPQLIETVRGVGYRLKIRRPPD